MATKDMLEQLFAWQAELNARIGFDPLAHREKFDPAAAGQWITNYLLAMGSELEELRDCTYWKHWCKEAKEGKRFTLHNLQNARVEVIDMLFFWISLAQCVGLNAEEAFEIYRQKLEVNHNRQTNGYARANKTEDDNKNIGIK